MYCDHTICVSDHLTIYTSTYYDKITNSLIQNSVQLSNASQYDTEDHWATTICRDYITTISIIALLLETKLFNKGLQIQNYSILMMIKFTITELLYMSSVFYRHIFFYIHISHMVSSCCTYKHTTSSFLFSGSIVTMSPF